MSRTPSTPFVDVMKGDLVIRPGDGQQHPTEYLTPILRGDYDRSHPAVDV